MPRETKEQKLARLAAEQAALDAQQAEQYLPRLMHALEEATNKNNYELTVVDGKFKLSDRDRSYDSWEYPVLLSPTYTQSSWEDLENLEFELELKTKARVESERKYLVKQAALAKLSKEERELLGL